MAIIHTESLVWSRTPGDYTATKGYQSFSGTPQSPVTSGVTAPYAGTVNVVAQGTYAWIPPTQTATHYIMGTRYINDNGGSGSHMQMMLQDIHGSPLLYVLYDPAGFGTVTIQSGSTLVGTGNVTDDAQWHYWEAELNTNGTCTVRRDQAVIATGTCSVGTQVGFLQWGTGGGGFGGCHYCDWYVVDPTTGSNTTFLGDVRIEFRAASGAGASTQWTPVGAGSNFGCVADTSKPGPDGDTTYVTTGVVGNRDYYTLGNLDEVAPASIPGVVTYIAAKSPHVTYASLSSSGVRLDGATGVAGASAYAGARVVADVDPNTGSAWTVGAANAAQPGIVLAN